jgi:uncharacterized iron-regulated protein
VDIHVSRIIDHSSHQIHETEVHLNDALSENSATTAIIMMMMQQHKRKEQQ